MTVAVTPPVTPDPGPVTGCHGILALPPTSICSRSSPPCSAVAPVHPWAHVRGVLDVRSSMPASILGGPEVVRFVPWDLARWFAVGQGRVVRGAGMACTDTGSSSPAAFADAGASLPAVAPFPVAAHRTGRAVFPHPALGRDHAFAHGKLVVRKRRRVSLYSCQSRSSGKRTHFPDRTLCL